jgi:hypothetical protein
MVKESEGFPDENGDMWRLKEKGEVEGLGKEKLRNLV